VIDVNPEWTEKFYIREHEAELAEWKPSINGKRLLFQRQHLPLMVLMALLPYLVPLPKAGPGIKEVG
jgi:hypothetical protein